MRAVAQDISYTIPLALSAIAIVLFTGSLSTVDIVTAQNGLGLALFQNGSYSFSHGFYFIPYSFNC